MKADCYLILRKTNKGQEVRVSHITRNRPALDSNEAVVRLSLDLPDDLFEAPLISVPVEKRQVAVSVEVDEPI